MTHMTYIYNKRRTVDQPKGIREGYYHELLKVAVCNMQTVVAESA
jgi:hypothetical protein